MRVAGATGQVRYWSLTSRQVINADYVMMPMHATEGLPWRVGDVRDNGEAGIEAAEPRYAATPLIN